MAVGKDTFLSTYLKKCFEFYPRCKVHVDKVPTADVSVIIAPTGACQSLAGRVSGGRDRLHYDVP